MLFSIITVCFNSEKTIRQTFDSVLCQEYKDYEYIIVDGASTDGTVDIIREYEPKFEGRLRWVSEKDHGIYDAMNKGARMAAGQFLAWLNSDDYYEPDALQTMKNEIILHSDCNVCYGIRKLVDDSGIEEKLERHHHTHLSTGCIPHPASFVNRNLFLSAGGFDESYKICGDWDFFQRIFVNGSGHFHPVDKILVNFRNTGISNCNFRLREEEDWRLRLKNGFISQQEYQKWQKECEWKKIKNKILAFLHALFCIGILKKIIFSGKRDKN